MLLQEVSYEMKPYMYTAELENGVIITAYADGTAVGSDGNRYRIVSHLEEDEDNEEEVVFDGWELLN